MKNIAKLQYISRDDDKYSHSEQARIMFENGIEWVQLRMKKSSYSEMIKQAETAMKYAINFRGRLIVNDYIDIVREIDAHGIHLGLNDTPIDKAREILGNDVIIGGTANTIDDIKLQATKGADYIGLGPFRFTTTKEKLSPMLGLEGYQKLMYQAQKQNLSVPFIAVGGITDTDIEDIIKTGMHGIAVSGALFRKIIKQ
ncbi:MAG: thiamine phosphate synthase [Mangrovibacterium sp.]